MSKSSEPILKVISQIQQFLKDVQTIIEDRDSLNKEIYEKGSELLKFHVVLEENIFWLLRREYLEIIESFLNKEFNGEIFFEKIIDLERRSDEKIKALKLDLRSQGNITFTSKAIDFTKIISLLNSLYDLFDSKLEDSKSSEYNLSENGVREVIQNQILADLRKYCEED